MLIVISATGRTVFCLMSAGHLILTLRQLIR